MKKKYDRQIRLRCQTCGDTNFEFNEDQSWCKCTRCGREYHQGKQELIELNIAAINSEKESMGSEILNDVEKELQKNSRDAFKGNPNIKFK